MNKYIYSLVLFLFSNLILAEQRVIYTINDGWKFQKGAEAKAQFVDFDDNKWDKVNIPHTWNNLDTDDEEPGYYRGECWYRKNIFIDNSQQGRQAVIFFEGANQEVDFYINGQYIGNHKGGYTRFCFDITSSINYGAENIFAIKVTNIHNVDIPPLSADFTFYGGIYRDIYLQFMNPVHIAVNDYASSGVYIKTPKVSEKEALVQITALVSNNTDKNNDFILENIICDNDGKEIAKRTENIKVKKGETLSKISGNIKINNPRLWDIDDPYRYRVYTRVIDKSKKTILDEVVSPLGLRWFEFDVEKGFFLNGKWRKLVGTCRHQDFYQKGNALRDEMHIQDIMLIKEMGGNFLRVSHYPQDPIVMEMCDKLGILTSVEIPVVNAVTESEAFMNNSVEMAKEMIRQDFNRPSIIIWAYMNEILLRRPFTEENRLKEYYKYTEKIARKLEETIRQEDPSKYTMMAYHNAPKNYEDAKLTEIPMIQGWNLYQGWYEPDINEFQRLLDRAHNVYKDKILMVTEYGPGVDPRLHSYNSERFDFSQEYGLIYHRHYMNEMAKRPFIAGSSLWNLNDFYSESRVDAVPHVNNKGIVGLDRSPKDTYLFYKATLSEKPVLAIGNRDWKNRAGVANSNDGRCMQQVPVFTNAEKVELFVNNESLGVKTLIDKCAIFDVPFNDNENVLKAVAVINGVKVEDYSTIKFDLINSEPNNCDKLFTGINMMLGSPRYFDDSESGMAWIPEQEYKKGGFGYVGGVPYRRETSFGSMLGSEIDIFGTNQNPIFQTQRVGIESFIADVPDGEYSVYMYLAELITETNKEALVYNLGADAKQANIGNRSFGISINDTKMIDDFNVARDYGAGYAVIKKFIVNVKDGKGLNIDFHKKDGEPILNAIRIYKNY